MKKITAPPGGAGAPGHDAECPGRLRELHPHLCWFNLSSSQFHFLSRKLPRVGTQLWAVRNLWLGCFKFHENISVIPYTLAPLFLNLMNLYLNQQLQTAAPLSFLSPGSASFAQTIRAQLTNTYHKRFWKKRLYCFLWSFKQYKFTAKQKSQNSEKYKAHSPCFNRIYPLKTFRSSWNQPLQNEIKENLLSTIT